MPQLLEESIVKSKCDDVPDALQSGRVLPPPYMTTTLALWRCGAARGSNGRSNLSRCPGPVVIKCAPHMNCPYICMSINLSREIIKDGQCGRTVVGCHQKGTLDKQKERTTPLRLKHEKRRARAWRRQKRETTMDPSVAAPPSASPQLSSFETFCLWSYSSIP